MKPKIAQDVKEKPKLAPPKIVKKAPPRFDYDQRTLTTPDDARKIVPALNALTNADKAIKKILEDSAGIRNVAKEKSMKYEQEQGLSDLQQRIMPLAEKLSSEIDNVEVLGKTVLEHKGTLLAMHQVVKKGMVSPTEKSEALLKAFSEYMDKDIANKIMRDTEDAMKVLATSRDTIQSQLSIWPAPQDLRKKIKQEETFANKTAGIWDVIKPYVDKLGALISSAYTSITDSLSSAFVAADQGTPIIEDIKQILGSTLGSKKCANKDVADSIVDAWLQDDFMQSIQLAKTNVESLKEAREYIASNEDNLKDTQNYEKNVFEFFYDVIKPATTATPFHMEIVKEVDAGLWEFENSDIVVSDNGAEHESKVPTEYSVKYYANDKEIAQAKTLDEAITIAHKEVNKEDGLDEVDDDVANALNQMDINNKNKENSMKTKTAAYSENRGIFDNRSDYADALIEALYPENVKALLDDVVSAMGDSEAFKNFDYISTNNELGISQSDYTNRSDYAEELIAMLDVDSFWSELLAAQSDDEAFANFDYLVRMNDLHIKQDGTIITTEDALEEGLID